LPSPLQRGLSISPEGPPGSENPEEPHLAQRDVSEAEIDEFFTESRFMQYQRPDESYVAYAHLDSGRFLQVIYRKIEPERLFIITAFDLQHAEIINILKGLEEK